MIFDDVLEILSRETQEFAVPNGDDRRRSWRVRYDGHLTDHLVAPDFGHGGFHAIGLLDQYAKPATDEDIHRVGRVALSDENFARRQILLVTAPCELP